jgi:hypothetical protein
MLNDTKLRNLKPRPTRYKVKDRDGLYVLVTPTGCISFRYDYRLNDRRETFVIGRSPAQAKRKQKQRDPLVKTFCEYAEDWLREANLAKSTKDMRRAIYNKDIYPRFKRRGLKEISEDDIRSVCERIKARNAPATALHVRDVMKAIFDFGRAYSIFELPTAREWRIAHMSWEKRWSFRRTPVDTSATMSFMSQLIWPPPAPSVVLSG